MFYYEYNTEVVKMQEKAIIGRRNLNDFQRNEVALKYEKVIAERMKERMSEAGKEFGKGMIGVDQMNHPYEAKTSKRKELAKIAGTSEGSTP